MNCINESSFCLGYSFISNSCWSLVILIPLNELNNREPEQHGLIDCFRMQDHYVSRETEAFSRVVRIILGSATWFTAAKFARKYQSVKVFLHLVSLTGEENTNLG